MTRRAIGYATPGKVQTVAVETDEGVELIRRQTHYSTELVAPERPQRAAPADPVVLLIKRLEQDCRRWIDILNRSPLPGEYIALKRSGQAARWLDMAYEKSVDQAPIQVIKTKKGVEIRHDAPRMRAPGVTSEELSWMDRMTDVLFTLRPKSLAWFLVFGRAQRKKWEEIAAYDVERRGVRQLQNLYREVLINLLPVWLVKVHKI